MKENLPSKTSVKPCNQCTEYLRVSVSKLVTLWTASLSKESYITSLVSLSANIIICRLIYVQNRALLTLHFLRVAMRHVVVGSLMTAKEPKPTNPARSLRDGVQGKLARKPTERKLRKKLNKPNNVMKEKNCQTKVIK